MRVVYFKGWNVLKPFAISNERNENSAADVLDNDNSASATWLTNSAEVRNLPQPGVRDRMDAKPSEKRAGHPPKRELDN